MLPVPGSFSRVSSGGFLWFSWVAGGWLGVGVGIVRGFL